MNSYTHETARVHNSEIKNAKIYRNVVIRDCKMGLECSIGDDTTVERCILGNNVIINRRSYINDSQIGQYTYMGINTTINFVSVGNFCSLGHNVDVGGLDHDYRKVTTIPLIRYKQMVNGGGKIPELFDERTLCKIGNDVWIAAGAQILHKVKVGDGAVIGAGAVVTKDVPPYAIVVGVPATIIGYRCSDKQIKELESIKWWNWSRDKLDRYMPQLIEMDIDDETIKYMKKIGQE